MSRLKATYIKNLRVEKGMTQQELADLVNVRRSAFIPAVHLRRSFQIDRKSVV